MYRSSNFVMTVSSSIEHMLDNQFAQFPNLLDNTGDVFVLGFCFVDVDQKLAVIAL